MMAATPTISAAPLISTRPTAPSSPRPPSPSAIACPRAPRGLLALSAAAAALAASCALPATCSAASLALAAEPSNALSLPTWAIHVSSVVEWMTAMALVWEYGDRSGFDSWKGLSWGMVPALGGALCACTWHFFYNSESLEILVALQAALTVIGNFTMCIAAYRIYESSRRGSQNP